MSYNQNKTKQSDFSSWIFPILMLVFFPPLGVLLVVLKLLGGSRRGGISGRHPYYVQKEGQGPMGARTTAGAPSVETGAPSAAQHQERQKMPQDQMDALAAKGKKLTTIGGILTATFGFVILTSLGSTVNLLFQGEFQLFLSDLAGLIPIFCFLGGGLGCLWAGVRKRKQIRRYRSYLAMIGRRQSIAISSMASATGLHAGKVREDLEDMLNNGLFPAGFLDYGGDVLILSDEGLSQERTKPAQEEYHASPTPHETENAILSEIRSVNDAVSNEKLSAQIDRIGIITAKILEYQKNRPEAAPQLHSFLSYYLPTTLKILRAYGQLEAQEVSGENINAAMVRIEGMMDKVVEGFEKQLDQLFQGDAMDITTDVEVLERMLAKDGLSSSQGLTLGL
ncbi:MAG: 5-bromo-4-chloroindolyl phosphate hydrolysis family protein [Lawsonibacter sp.]